MIKIQKHIEIVRTNQPGRSSLSQASCDAIRHVLLQHYATVGMTLINSESDLAALVAKQPDLVFSGIKYINNTMDDNQVRHKIWVAEYLHAHGIAHTGSPQPAIKLELNKELAKQRIMQRGLRTADFTVLRQDESYSELLRNAQYPLFIKPSTLGGGQGIADDSVIRDVLGLETKIIALRAAYDSDIIVESYLAGNEYSVSVLRDQLSDELLIMPVQMVTIANSRGDHVLTNTVKTNDEETAIPVTDLLIKQKVSRLARRVFEALGARDYGRIDIRLDDAGVPHFLEANLIPSLISGYGSFPKSCLINRGLSYDAMILSIVWLGLHPSEDTHDAHIGAVESPSLDPVLAT